LSNYCHAQAHPAATLSDPAWISSGHALIDELYAYFEQEMSGGATAMLWPDNMTPEARMIWEDLEQAKPR
jgi:hypothetical protein